MTSPRAPRPRELDPGAWQQPLRLPEPRQPPQIWLARPDELRDLTAPVAPSVLNSEEQTTAADCLPALYKAAADGLPTLADSGYQGAEIGIRRPFKKPHGTSHQELHVDTQTYNILLRGVRTLGERTAAELHGTLVHAQADHAQPVSDRRHRPRRARLQRAMGITLVEKTSLAVFRARAA